MTADPVTSYRRFSATLRIMNAPEIHDEIEKTTGIKPTHVHVRGDIAFRGTKKVRLWENDLWSLKSPLDGALELSRHLDWLWDTIEPHADYFQDLAEKGVKMDVFCGYRSDSDEGGFSLTSSALQIVQKLGISVEFSVIIA